MHHFDLLEEWLSVWHRSDGDLPPLGRGYSTCEQSRRESQVDRVLAGIQARLLESGKDFSAIVGTAARLACLALDIDDNRTEALLREDFSAVARDLASRARSLDAAVSTADILQACRNAWTACGLQAVFGGVPRLTPAIFAYSMLYPYSDNYLDDNGVSGAAKLRFSARFKRRLAGDASPAGALEKIIWRLISLIEDQWPRKDYPEVYHSLLSIHRAQESSLQQQRAVAPGGPDILRLSFAKGGASVLADAYPAKGILSEVEERFAFGWGALLQLGDDLQDLKSDRQKGFRTLFSSVPTQAPLDPLVTKTLHFANAVMGSMRPLAGGEDHLKELLRKNSVSLLITAAAEYSEFFTPAYLLQLERYSPLRFAFLRSRRESVARWLAPDTQFIDDLLFSLPPSPWNGVRAGAALIRS